MTTVSYKIKYRKNEGLMFSVNELLTLYFYGINIQSFDGVEFDNQIVRYYILQAQKEIENYLQVKLDKKLITETLSYYSKDYYNKFPYFKTKYPVNEVFTLMGLLGTAEQIVYPKDWLKSKVDSEGDYTKAFSLVPTGTGAGVSGNQDVILTGIMRDIGIRAYKNVPDYWDVQYLSGYDFNNTPNDIVGVIGKLASIGVFAMAGDLIVGAGIANYSLSIDGLSQSIGTTSSATNSGYGARITQYSKEVKETLNRIKFKYRGINIASM